MRQEKCLEVLRSYLSLYLARQSQSRTGQFVILSEMLKSCRAEKHILSAAKKG